MKKPKTPEELASEARERGGFRLYLNKKNMQFLEESAAKAGIKVSKIVDEAIERYIETISKKKK